jgi:hypothetical protein
MKEGSQEVSHTGACGRSTAVSAKQAAIGIVVAGALCIATVLGTAELALSHIRYDSAPPGVVVGGGFRSRRAAEDGSEDTDFEALPDEFG